MEKTFGKIKGIDVEKRLIDVVASTETVDRHGESINQLGWELNHYLKNPVILWAHNYSELPIGKAEKVWVEDNKLMATIKFATHNFANEVWNLVKDGFIKSVSVGFRVLKFGEEDNKIDKAELYEISFVPVPANPEALVQLGYKENEAKDLEAKFKTLLDIYNKEIAKKNDKADEKWEVCGSRDLPTDDEDSWDGDKARDEMEKWANGDWEKYKKGFVVRDANNKETLGAYKLPFARVKDGKLVATWGGVKAAMGAVLGARGGVKLPEEVRKGAYNFLASYYKKFDKEVPEYKQYSEEELGKLFDEKKSDEKLVISKDELKKLIKDSVKEYFEAYKELKENEKEKKQKEILKKVSKAELLKEMLNHLREADKQVGLGLQKANLYQKKIEFLNKIKSYYQLRKGGEKNGREYKGNHR
jgi:HK97 family phage prohead protease